MSDLNLSYEIDNRSGELSYFEDRCIKKPLQLANIIAGEIVKEILDNAFDIVAKANNTSIIGDVEAVEKKLDGKVNELEMRKLQSETLGPYDVITYDTIHVKGGIGDQPFDDKIGFYDNKIEPENIRTVEKKSRVTDLIKNSRQIITEYLMVDEKAKRSQDDWEESEEKLIQVIELDVETVKLKPEPSVFNHDEDGNDKKKFEITADDGLDIIDLSARAFKEEEKQIVNSQLAKGDQQERPTEQVPSRNDNVVDGVNTHSLTEKQCGEELSKNKVKENKFKNKKWNFGTKFWGFLKKNNKNDSSSTSKINKQ